VGGVAVVSLEFGVGRRLIFSRPVIEFMPCYRPRAPTTFQIALHNSRPELIRRGGEIVQFHPRADLPSSIAKGMALFAGPNTPFNHHIVSCAQEPDRQIKLESFYTGAGSVIPKINARGHHPVIGAHTTRWQGPGESDRQRCLAAAG